MQTHPTRIPFAALFLALVLVCLGGGCTPSGPKALLQGAELIRKGKYSAAIAKLKIAKDLLPNDARAWNYLGLAYHGAGQYGEAIIAYQRAQHLDQNLAEARFNLGELFLEQGNPVSAAEELAVFTVLQPKSVDGWVRLGDAHLQNQRLDRAQTSYNNALNLRRETPEAFNGIGLILLQRKKPWDAYRYFVEATKYDANYAPAILNMAVVAHTHLGSRPTALIKYREYLSKSPDATNASAVQTAIRQLDAELNPRPPQSETKVAAVNDVPPATASSNSEPVVVARPDVVAPKPTNSSSTVNTNIAHSAHAAAGKTNFPAGTPASNPVPSAKSETVAVRPAAATNPPPVQSARAEAPKASMVAEKPAVGTTEAKVNQPISAGPAAQRTPVSTTVASASTGKPVDELPLEVVTLEDAAVQPAGEVTVAGEIQAPSVIQSGSPNDASSKLPNQAPPSVGQDPVATDEKRGFFQRINPANLFRSSKSTPPAKRPTEIITPLTADDAGNLKAQAAQAAPATRAPHQVALASTNRSEVTPISETRSGSGYQYGKIKKPVPGDRPTAERLFARGVGAQSRRDPVGAASFFSAAVEADPTYFPGHYNLGLVGYSSGQWFKALSAFETALVLDPNSAEARYNFALTLQKAGFPADSARELEKLLTRKPDDTRAMLLLGNVYSQDLSDIAGARRQYQQLLAREPQHPQATPIRYWLSEHP